MKGMDEINEGGMVCGSHYRLHSDDNAVASS